MLLTDAAKMFPRAETHNPMKFIDEIFVANAVLGAACTFRYGSKSTVNKKERENSVIIKV